jgi:hypothetical protein
VLQEVARADFAEDSDQQAWLRISKSFYLESNPFSKDDADLEL